MMLYLLTGKLKRYSRTGAFKQILSSAPASVTGLYVIDSLIRRESGKNHGCHPAPDPSKHRFSDLYHGADHQNHPLLTC